MEKESKDPDKSKRGTETRVHKKASDCIRKHQMKELGKLEKLS